MLGELLEIEKAARHSRDITSQLLAFSRRQIISPKVLDLNELITETNRTLLRLLGEDIDLRFTPAAGLWKVRVDPAQINQVLVNLALNARDAMPAGGQLTLETRNLGLDESYCRSHVEGRPGEYVQLTVSDNGPGMDSATRVHIFEPFFTTKSQGKGTGLGLATVYGSVKQNGGFTTVYSEVGIGTTFKIYLPRTYLDDEGKEPVSSGKIGSVSGHVLLLEDDPLVRKIVSSMLESLGCVVLTAATPSEALATAAREEVSIDLLVSDVVMPEMSGQEVSDRIRDLRPGLRVLFISGFTDNVIVQRGILGPGVHFLQKPFSLHDLAAKLRDALAAADTDDGLIKA